jgi:hypothetical protein
MKKLFPGFLITLLISCWCQAQKPVVRSQQNLVHLAVPGLSASSLLFLFDNDGGIAQINSVPAYQCNSSLAPSVVIQNFGSNTLTSAIVLYRIDAGQPQYLEWTGALEPYYSDTIFLPELNVPPGTHTLTVEVTEANGETDVNDQNDYSIQFSIVGPGVAAPYVESFSLPYLPEGYFVENVNTGPSWMVLELPGGNYGGYGLLMPFYYNDADGDKDNVYIKNLDLSNLQHATLGFDVAYSFYSEHYFDRLRVSVSSDCGAAWEPVYDKAKDELATAPFSDVYFIPTSSQWRRELVDLSAFAGSADVLIRFEAISGHGNNLYIDNIGVEENTGIGGGETDASGVRIFPNPASEYVNVKSAGSEGFGEGSIIVFDTWGRAALTQNISFVSGVLIPLSGLAAGHYVVQWRSENFRSVPSPLIIAR